MKVTNEVQLSSFEFWSGAKPLANMLTVEEFDIIEQALDELYPDGIDETHLNDLFWFDGDYIAEIIGFESEEELIQSSGRL